MKEFSISYAFYTLIIPGICLPIYLSCIRNIYSVSNNLSSALIASIQLPGCSSFATFHIENLIGYTLSSFDRQLLILLTRPA